ncbi:fatty acyl-CoA reductase 1-like [Anoplophora glabripennis]|uniref:fatty acyl-CoA reductase 1-like n=1 Tax=Anoplophora glabripennis TaxID=217634 RepID=UPI000C75FD68|nr:fatty acyl-CoA reductase 1-like [Anoplophora glabripennis]
MNSFATALSNESWIDTYQAHGTEAKFNNFHSILMYHFNANCPRVSKCVPKGTGKQWVNEAIKESSLNLKDLYRMQIVDSNLTDTYKNAKKNHRLLIKKTKNLTEEDTQTLIQNVDIIYHGAASIRFDDHLKDAVLLNTRGTKEVVDIALQAKKLLTFVHISTSYCNCDRFEVEEKMYLAHADWKSTITLAEQVDQHTLSILSPKYIYPLPNTYTFAKSLSDHVVNDLCKGKLLTTIVRPSIVVPSLDEPISGWCENFNGPVGLLCGGGKGVLKTCYGDENSTIDWLPVGILSKFLILITYEKALYK